MAWVGRSIAALGILLIVVPVLAGALSLMGRRLPVVVDYGPTFVLGGILVFVVGIGVRTFAGR